jgi:hypothetical protein
MFISTLLDTVNRDFSISSSFTRSELASFLGKLLTYLPVNIILYAAIYDYSLGFRQEMKPSIFADLIVNLAEVFADIEGEED